MLHIVLSVFLVILLQNLGKKILGLNAFNTRINYSANSYEHNYKDENSYCEEAGMIYQSCSKGIPALKVCKDR